MNTSSDVPLLIWAVAGVVLLVLLITTRIKLHPFLALILASLFIGVGSGSSASKVTDSFVAGAGSTFGSTGIIIVLGVILGRLLAESHGTERLAQMLLRNCSLRSVPWRVSLLAAIIGIPMFNEVAITVMLPILFALARRVNDTLLHEGRDKAGRKVSPYVLVSVPAMASAAAMHAFIPPHPGPLTAIGIIGADTGKTLGLGLPVAVIALTLGGPLLAVFLSRRVFPVPPRALLEQFSAPAGDQDGRRAAGTPAIIAGVLLPVVLMLGATVADLTLDKGNQARTVLDFLGEPIVALFIAALVAVVNFGLRSGLTMPQMRASMESGMGAIGAVILVICAGGGISKVMVDAGVGDAIAELTDDSGLPVLLTAYLIAVALRLSVGSATVAVITAAGIVAPIASANPDVNAQLLVLAVGAGSIFFPHVNNGGSWFMKESFGMSLPEMFKTFSVLETVISISGLGLVLALSTVI